MFQTTLESLDIFLGSLANQSFFTIPSTTLKYEYELPYIPVPQQQHNRIHNNFKKH